MNCCILYRVNGGKLQFVGQSTSEDGEHIAEFPNIDEAVHYAMCNSLFDSGQAEYQIVELDEL
jgi:hypothetical protein